MCPVESATNTSCAIYADVGTTSTRVWLVAGDKILAKSTAAVGARDTAREGSKARLRSALRETISDVRAKGMRASVEAPAYVVAAGMITSPLGLAEVPHISAPAGLTELAAATKRHQFPDVTDLDVLLVPGVRTGLRQTGLAGACDTDLMRGEETLCIGLLATGELVPGATLLNLGSHWKAVRIDEHGHIASSLTSLSGELLHAAQTQTVLASAVPDARPSKLDAGWVAAGMREQRRSSLTRALFCVRLLEQHGAGTSVERLAFLVGAFVAADLDALLVRGAISAERPVMIAGGAGVAAAWKQALAGASVPSVLLDEGQVEHGLLMGLRRVIEGGVNVPL